MRLPKSILHASVNLLTVLSACTMSACSLISEHYAEPCKSYAYNRSILADHLSSRFNTGEPVRLGIIPFNVQANLAYNSVERPGLGYELASRVHAELLKSGQIPIVELMNRTDWPGKKEEFFTGNYGAIYQARDAGYDLVMTGYVEPLHTLDSMTVYTRIIEVESGLTLWYGRTVVVSMRPEVHTTAEILGMERRDPSRVYFYPMIGEVAQCVANAILKDEVVPE